jgi:hypothetical protein
MLLPCDIIPFIRCDPYGYTRKRSIAIVRCDRCDATFDKKDTAVVKFMVAVVVGE